MWSPLQQHYSLVSRKVAVFTVSASNVTVIKATWWKTSFFRRVEFSENVCRSIAFCCKIQCVFKVCQCWHHFVVCHKTLKKKLIWIGMDFWLRSNTLSHLILVALQSVFLYRFLQGWSSQKKFGLKRLANNNRGEKMQSDQIYSFMKNFVGGISSSSTFADRLDFRV